jgi:hypothetical protein
MKIAADEHQFRENIGQAGGRIPYLKLSRAHTFASFEPVSSAKR